MRREEWGQRGRRREETAWSGVREQSKEEERRLGKKKAVPLRSTKHTNSENCKGDGERSERRGGVGKEG